MPCPVPLSEPLLQIYPIIKAIYNLLYLVHHYIKEKSFSWNRSVSAVNSPDNNNAARVVGQAAILMIH